MSVPSPRRLAGICILFSMTALPLWNAWSADPIKFRTDENADDQLPWFVVQDGKFPPPDSAHAVSGELISVDHPRRKFILRVDRADNQRRSHYDLPLAVEMLPYGSIYYHGIPASLDDIPLGTHLNGLFYVKDPNDKTKPLDDNGRVTREADFTRCFRLEDDFSYHQNKNQLWKIDSIDLEKMELIATLDEAGKPVGDKKTFDLLSSTRVWKGKGFEDLKALKPGQKILMNLTWATLYGPGRVREIWVDAESRKHASAHQLKKHQEYIRTRGIPGWVDEVDNQKKIITVMLFSGQDESLYQEIKKGDGVGIAVAEYNLMTYDPLNDRKRGPVLSVKHVPQKPGSSGIQLQLQPDLLLEGFRPGRVVRIYAGGWRVIQTPREERYGLGA